MAPRSSPGTRAVLVLVAWCAAFAMFGGRPAWASSARTGELEIREVLPLTVTERGRLATLVRSDPEVQALFAAREAEARERLSRAPRPLAEIHYEGLVNTDARRIATVDHLQDMEDAAALFEVWQVTADERLAAKLRDYIRAWSAVYRPTGNDVNENKLTPLYVAYGALRAAFAAAERDAVDRWLDELASRQRAVDRQDGHRGKTNRYTKRLRLLALITLARGGELSPFWSDVRTFVTDALHADGTSYDLQLRDSLSYHTSALVPLLDLALLARREGVDLYGWQSVSGASLRKSVEYVVPFADGSKTRTEWTHSKVELDRRRAAAGIPEYQPGIPYHAVDALRMLEGAEAFDPALAPLVARLAGRPSCRFPTWRTVLNAVCR